MLLAALATRLVPDDSGLDSRQRSVLALAALGGAVIGAYGFELPADLFGWTAPPPPGTGGDALPIGSLPLGSLPLGSLPLGGRTVLGGILGGWIAVELFKHRLGVRTPTGDGFALPLAIALACGRVGCALTGCCAGVECAPSPLAWIDGHGTPRVPVQVIEVGFHALSALWIARAAFRGVARGRRLAIYVSGYGALRFMLEYWREHPPVLFGLSWYQLLSLTVGALGVVTCWRRRGADFATPPSRE